METNVVNTAEIVLQEIVLQDLCRPRSPSGGRKFQKVPQCLRDENKDHLYDPKIVSFGPYHHGNLKFQITEEYKYKVMQHLIPGHNDVVNNYNSFLASIKEIRDCYVEGSTDHYSDAELARMMLLDACLLLSFMLDITSDFSAPDRIIFAIADDILLLENQIPLWILKRLATSIGGGATNFAELLGEFCRYMVFWRDIRTDYEAINDTDEQGSRAEHYLHLLEFCREAHVFDYYALRRDRSSIFKLDMGCITRSKTPRRIVEIDTFRSVIDLKSKGILCKPSSLETLAGIKFKSYYLFAQLELPPLRIDTNFMVMYANMIAYEMSIDNPAMVTACQITDYIKFVKSLVMSAEDVKELREEGILFNGLGTDKEVVKVLQEIPAGPLLSLSRFLDLTWEIQQHTGSKKVLLAELNWKYFSRPWSFMKVLGILLFGLTLAQSYFTIYPRK